MLQRATGLTKSASQGCQTPRRGGDVCEAHAPKQSAQGIARAVGVEAHDMKCMDMEAPNMKSSALPNIRASSRKISCMALGLFTKAQTLLTYVTCVRCVSADIALRVWRRPGNALQWILRCKAHRWSGRDSPLRVRQHVPLHCHWRAAVGRRRADIRHGGLVQPVWYRQMWDWASVTVLRNAFSLIHLHIACAPSVFAVKLCCSESDAEQNPAVHRRLTLCVRNGRQKRQWGAAMTLLHVDYDRTRRA